MIKLTDGGERILEVDFEVGAFTHEVAETTVPLSINI